MPDGCIDHLWIRVADLPASKRFYTTIALHAGIRLVDDEPGRVRFTGEDHQLLADRRRAAAQQRTSTSRSSPSRTPRCARSTPHALAAGYEDHGGPGERASYHPGYYGAFVLDPDGLNVEVVNHNR